MHLLPWHGMHLSIQTWLGILTFIANHSWVERRLWVSIATGSTAVGLGEDGFPRLGEDGFPGDGKRMLGWRVVGKHSECSNARLER